MASQEDHSSSDDESNTAVNSLLRTRDELPATYISKLYYAPGIVRSARKLGQLETTLHRRFSIDKVVAHATLRDVLVVEGYTPEFDPAKVLAAIRKLDSQARFND